MQLINARGTRAPRPGRRGVRGVAFAVGLATLLSSFAFVASASATSFSFLNAFGATGITYTLDKPYLDAVDPVNNWLYVAEHNDSDQAVVERFNLDGSPAPFTGSGFSDSNVIGLPDINGNQAVFKNTTPAKSLGSSSADAANIDCTSDANNANPYANPVCFSEPTGVAVDGSGNVYVTDREADVVEVFHADGTWAGYIGPYFDTTHINGDAGSDYFGGPTGIAVDTTHNLLFVADGEGYVDVFSITGTTSPTFKFVKQLGGDGSAANQFEDPWGITTDGAGHFWVADWDNDRVDEWAYSWSGTAITASPAAGSPWPTPSGYGPEAVSYSPGDGALTPASVFVTDDWPEVDQFDATSTTAGGSLIGEFGSYGGDPSQSQFEAPYGIATMPVYSTFGTTMWIVDHDVNQVDVFTPGLPPQNTAAPGISGSPVQGQTLTASPGTWSSTTAVTYDYQWQRCDAGGANCYEVQDGASSNYILTGGDVGATIRVGVTANNGQQSQVAFSGVTAVVTAPNLTPTPTPTPAPTPTPTTTTPPPAPINTKVTSVPTKASSTTVLSKGGQKLKFKTVAGAHVKLQLILSAKTAKRVGLGNGKHSLVVGTKHVTAPKNGHVSVTAILTKAARAALRSYHKRFKMILRTTFTSGGKSYTINRTEVVNWANHKKHK